MSGENKMKKTGANKKSDGKFGSKHVSHDRQNESARAKFGSPGKASDGTRTLHENQP